MAPPTLRTESCVNIVILALVVVCMSSHEYSAQQEVEEEDALYGRSSFHLSDDKLPPIVEGLSWSFYNNSCPNLENIVHKALKPFLDEDITQAAGLLRLHFHDCFVQGCDASLLLDGTASEPSEKSAIPNLTLRPEAFEIISNIKSAVEAVCPRTVSCADIVTIVARDSVAKAKGPRYPVPLGRRDSILFANQSVVLDNLPSPSSNVTQLMSVFSSKGLDFKDLVALSGGHTIGRAHCGAFVSRLYPQDPNLNPKLASQLKIICPTSNSTNVTNLDVHTPNRFDNQYYRDLLDSDGLLTSDSSLILDARTNATTLNYFSNQTLFFEEFSLSMIKMGQLGILINMQGEVRTNCSMASPTSFSINNKKPKDLLVSSF